MTQTTTNAKPAAYFVYATLAPTNAGFEGERKTLHNARRLAASLNRQGFNASIQVAMVDGDRSWCELVETHPIDKFLATATARELAAIERAGYVGDRS